MNNFFGGIVGSALLLLMPLVAAAETVYVIDVIRVGLRPDQTADSKPLDVVPSGTPLEVLSRDRKFIRARSPDGKIGWIADGWVTSEVPPRQQLEKLQEEHARLQEELQKQTDTAKQIEEQYNKVAASLAEATQSADDNSAELAELRERTATASAREQTILTSAAAALVAATVLSFLFGYATYRRKVEAKFGGLSI